MPLYESTFIARQDISQADVERLTKEFSSIVETNGGKIVKNEYWGLRNLAYVIQKNKKGHYVFFGLDAPAAAVKEMERKIGLNEDVIRQLTVRVEAISKEPSPVLQNNTYDVATEEEVSNA
ncbi:MAG: 30S ribosomal protein S6 [Proteobacteria bacterium]|nr:30S ribosomal protein S6 [Pseudomonadota bacterium]